MMLFNLEPKKSQDFHVHSQLCSALLEHYAAQWRDREVYWRARERSALHGDLMTIIIDSFDRSKLYLPKFPFNRIPKRPAYQAYSRILDLFAFPLRGSFTFYLAHASSTHILGQFCFRSFVGAYRCALSWAWLLDVFVSWRRDRMRKQLELGVCYLLGNSLSWFPKLCTCGFSYYGV